MPVNVEHATSEVIAEAEPSTSENEGAEVVTPEEIDRLRAALSYLKRVAWRTRAERFDD